MGHFVSDICSEPPGVGRFENIFSLDVFSEHSTPSIEDRIILQIRLQLLSRVWNGMLLL